MTTKNAESVTDLANGTPDPAKAAKLAQQIVGLLSEEDQTTRQRAIQAAAMLLGDSISQPRINKPDALGGAGDNEHDLASFFNRDEDMKPSDYAFLSAAYHFSQFGTAPFSVAEINTIASDAGVVLPDRLDMTFRAATKKGKKLFQSAGRGLFKPTAAGGLEFGERWSVRPGRKAKTATTNA